MNFLAVALGGALGAMGRYFIIAYMFPVHSNRFPTGTLIANVIGCVFIGVLYVVIIQKDLLGPQWRLLLITGLFGALTTFSTFSLEAVQLWHFGHMGTALLYVVASLFACLASTAIAIYLTNHFFQLIINY